MKNFKLLLVAIAVLFLNTNKVFACHGMPLINYNVTIGATGVTINGSSDPSTCGCGPYWMQTQISCSPSFYSGAVPACMQSSLAAWNVANGNTYLNYPYYNSLLNVPNYSGPGWFDNCTLEPYHPTFIPFANLCPGKVYYIRTRDYPSTGTPGPWSAVTTFTVPGTAQTTPPNTLNMTLQANPNPIICCGNVALTAVITGTNWGQCIGNVPSCERNMTVTPTFSWSSSNPVTTNVGAGSTFTTSINVLNVTNLSTTTTFSVWLAYLCTSPTGNFTYTPPGTIPIIFPMSSLSNSNISTPFITAPANAVWTQALNQCLSGSCMCQFLNAQPAVVTVNVLSVPPVLTPTYTPNTCLSAPNFTFTDIAVANNFNVTWNFGDGSPVATGSNVVHTYTTAGIYTVTVIKSSCGPCVANQSFTVQVYPAANPVILVNTPVCIGGTANFSVTGTSLTNFVWSGPQSFTSTQQYPSISPVSANNAGLYTCTVTNVNGCKGTATINLNTYQATMTGSSNSPICIGTTASLIANNAANASWTGPNGFTSPSVNPTFIMQNNMSGNYNVTATLTNGCYASTVVSVASASTSVTASHNGPSCSGNSFTLHANGNGTFVWAGPNGFTSTSQHPVVNNASNNASGIYTVTITSPQGCVATATTYVNVPLPKIINPTSTGTVCEGGTIYFDPQDGTHASYLWEGPNGFIDTKANTAIQSAPVAASGVYTLTIKDNNGCSARGFVPVLINPNPILDIDMTNAQAGCAPRCSVAYKLNSNVSVSDIKWNFGNGANNNTPNPSNLCYQTAGKYNITVEATDVKGCSSKTTKLFEVYPTPIADFKPIQKSDGSWTHGEIKFNDQTTGATITSWNWTFGVGDANSQNQNPSFTYQDSGKYEVNLEVKSDKGCVNKVSKKVVVADELGLFVPNAFTPNGDGQNDVFMAVSNSVNKFEMQIFNRGGSLVYQTSDIRKGWDGTFKGQEAENNVYVYKITYITKDNKSNTITGNVTLVR